MNDLLVNIFSAGTAIISGVSFLFFDRLLGMESKAPEHQRHYGGRAAGIFSPTRDLSRTYPQWSDIKALLLGLPLYGISQIQMPLWVRNAVPARRGLGIMRALFWLSLV